MIKITSNKVRECLDVGLTQWIINKILLIMVLFGTISLNAQNYSVVGNGTSVNSANEVDYPAPLNNYYFGTKQQYFVTAAELLQAGIVANNNVFSLGFNVQNLNSVPVLNNYIVKVYTTSATDPIGSSWFTGVPVATTNITGGVTVNLGWNMFEFSSPFVWNGTDNLIIEVCSNNTGWVSNGSAAVYMSTNLTGSAKKSRFVNRDAEGVCSSADWDDALSTHRPNIQFMTAANVPACSQPSGLNASSLTTNSAILGWTSTGTNFDIQYGPVGFNIGSGTVISNVANNYLLGGLQPVTSYQYYVRNVCSTESSFWKGPFTFTTLCPTYSVLNESFDTTANNFLPSCWSSYISSGAGSVYTSTTYSLSPSKSCYVYYSSGSNANVMLISPPLNIPTTPMVLEFAVRGAVGATVIVGKMTNPNDPATFTPIQTVTLAGSTTTFNYYGVNIEGGASYIAFKHGMVSTYSSVYIDDISLNPAPSCPAVNIGSLTATNITYNQAVLSWGSDSTDFEIEWGIAGFTPGTGTTISNVTNNYLLTGLAADTNYSYYVKSTCSADSPKRGPYTFKTLLVKPSPWFEGFATNVLPAGFTVTGFSLTNDVNSNPGSTGYFYRQNQWTSGATGSVTTVNVGPVLPGDKFSFGYSVIDYYNPLTEYVEAESVNFKVELYLNFSTTPIVLDEFSNGMSFDWNTVEYSLANYVGQVVKIKITATRVSGDYYLGIDNLYIGNCALPSLLTVSKTDVSATLSWEGYTGSDYEIQYGVNGFTLGTGTSVSGVLNNHVLTGLSGTTTYQVYVRKNCGTSQSPWVVYSFTTETVLPTPWYEPDNASAIPTGFVTDMYNTNSTTIIPNAFTYYFYRNIYSSNPSASLETMNVGPILPGDFLSFSYGFNQFTSSALSLDVFISTEFGANPSLLTTITPTDLTGWHRAEVALSAYVGQKIKLKFVYTLESGDLYVGLDNFYVGPCGLPAVPSATALSQTTATLSWNGEVGDSYQIEWGLAGFTQGSGNVISATGNNVTITNLTSNTQYEYFIRKSCVEGNSVWVGRYKFVTSCDPFTTGFAENFDTTPTGGIGVSTVPDCWSFYAGGVGYGYVTAGSVAPASPSRHFYIYNSNDLVNPYILISPETINLGDGGYQVRFKARGSSGAKVKVGRMSNKLDSSTFVEIHEFELPTAYSANDFIVYLPVTTDDYFAFKFVPISNYQNLYIDDVVYEQIPACAPPVSLNADKNLISLTANLTWTGPSNVTNNNFEIEWGASGFTLGTGTLTTSTTLNKEISGLTLGNSYSFYVRRICSGENTVWVGPYTFEMGYCTSVPTSNDGTGIGNVTIAGVSMDSTNDVTYEDFTNYSISFNAGDQVPASITFNTGFTYNTNIWIDLNNNGVFENATELFFVGESLNTNPTTLDTSFIVPSTGDYVTGNYRMRIGTADSGQVPPKPCYSGSYGVTVDLLVNIVFPCIQPTDINFPDVGYEYVVLDWEGQGNTNFELEYGPTGFVQGTGTVITNVTKPYTLNGLTPGATYDFYVRKQCADVYSDWSTVATTYVFCDTPQPTGEADQTLVSDDTLSQLVIQGQNLKFYTDPELTQEVPASTALQVSGTYFVTQTINCESDSYLIVGVTVLPRIAMPVVGANQVYCNGGVLADIPVTSVAGATVIWYATATSTTPLPLDTALVTGVYYVVQTNGVTTSHRVAVPVTVNITPPDLVSQQVHLCGNYTFGNLSVNNMAGTIVRWYTSENALTPIGNNVPVSTGVYYATQAFGTCESQRVAFEISQFDSLNKPIAGTQTFCGGGTVADLVADGVSGAQILWFASASSVNALSPLTALSNGTYYVSQTLNGCYSERRAVAVRVVSSAAPQLAPFTVCGGGTISDLYIPSTTGVTYKWYLSPSSTNELIQSTPLVQGTYFVERIQYGCVSQRAAVQVIIGSVPNPPTGVAQQSFVEGSTIANLMVSQSNVVWYANFNDSQNGVNPLPSYTPLVNGATYYAVIIGANGCPSYPFAVTVNVYLSSDEFVQDELKYYPNPVDDVLNVSYSDVITQVEVFDVLGKRVKTIKTNGNNIEVNLSDLASGTYMVQLKTESKQQFIKIVKK